MSIGDAPRVEGPPEFRSALEKLQRLFAGALHDSKFNSCHMAWHDIEPTKNAKKKVEILNKRFEQWREGSASAIREWLPKFVDLATAYPEVIDGPIHWAKDRVWETVEGVCGIQRGAEGEPLPIDWVVNRITVWWFAVASEFKPEVNFPTSQPWSAPRWLAPGRRETNELLEKHTGYLWLRVNCVINEAIDLAEIRRSSNRKERSARNAGRRRLNTAGVNAHEKLADPAIYPTMTVQEVMTVVNISRASVYRYLCEGRLDRPSLNKRPGKRSKTLVLTSSVQKMLKPAEE